MEERRLNPAVGWRVPLQFLLATCFILLILYMYKASPGGIICWHTESTWSKTHLTYEVQFANKIILQGTHHHHVFMYSICPNPCASVVYSLLIWFDLNVPTVGPAIRVQQRKSSECFGNSSTEGCWGVRKNQIILGNLGTKISVHQFSQLDHLEKPSYIRSAGSAES